MVVRGVSTSVVIGNLVDVVDKNQNDDENTETMRHRRTCLSKSKGRPKPPVKADTYQKLYR